VLSALARLRLANIAPQRFSPLERLGGRGAVRRPVLGWPFGVRANAAGFGGVRADAASAGRRPAPQHGVSPATETGSVDGGSRPA
jgi:hypothetical protein